jgi:hypothetical protein
MEVLDPDLGIVADFVLGVDGDVAATELPTTS